MAGLCEGGNEPHKDEKPPALRRLPVDLKLRSGAGSIPALADYQVEIFSEVFPNRKVNAREPNLVITGVRNDDHLVTGAKLACCESFVTGALSSWSIHLDVDVRII
ncbi:hypothetical protein ANN_14433 [Periplaneta americana]|uniref:Uncharacterized protein n=1 Tax=Periplaneta americana TaxID=6978 RepID=A0ABQ8SWX3_PERAM|nr:hypothetical protein ANN_14433 [Periplaneta americana]